LTTSRAHSTSQFHTQSFFKVQKDYTCYRKDLKSIQDENPIPNSLDQKQSQSKLQLFKSKINEKLKYVFLLLNLSSCLLDNLNKLFIAFKDGSKHLKFERNQL